MTVNQPRTALVTGAASGIGREWTLRLAEHGVRVAALDINAEEVKALAADSPNIVAFPCDVTDRQAVDAVVGEVDAEFGGLDRVVHCAAVLAIHSVLDHRVDDIERLLRINFLGTVNVAQATVPVLLREGPAELVLMASIVGWLPTPDVGAYGASKAAIVSFAEVLAAESRDTALRVVCVCPPAVETPMTKWVRENHPEVMGDGAGITPADVVAATERALPGRKLHVFPGRGTTLIWRARRFAPRLLGRAMDRLLRR